MRMGFGAVVAVALVACTAACGEGENDGAGGDRVEGLALGLLNAEGEEIDRLTVKAGQRARTQVNVVGFADDSVGCAGKFSTAVAPDAVEADVLNVEVEYEHVPGTACGGGITSELCGLLIPPLAAGEYTLRLSSGGCRDGCFSHVEGETHINIPLTVTP